jgi:hypothetical protein
MDSDGTTLRGRLQAVLGNAYVLERELGGGGMSRVFVARDVRLDRQVVVKVLHPDLAAGLSAERFEREIRLAARLQHPHIVPVHSAGAVAGLPFYTMPFVEGESLRARLVREGALPVNDVVRLTRELAYALAYAHGAGVMHRDLKPENVLLSAGHAVVADFGVAKALSAATQGVGPPEQGSTSAGATGLGVAVGTPPYMAPEQAAADPSTDHRADLYALGLIAYEALAGRHPFAGRSPQALFAAQLTEVPAPLADCRPDAPAQRIRQLTEGAIAGQADKRVAGLLAGAGDRDDGTHGPLAGGTLRQRERPHQDVAGRRAYRHLLRDVGSAGRRRVVGRRGRRVGEESVGERVEPRDEHALRRDMLARHKSGRVDSEPEGDRAREVHHHRIGADARDRRGDRRSAGAELLQRHQHAFAAEGASPPGGLLDQREDGVDPRQRAGSDPAARRRGAGAPLRNLNE